MGRATRFSIVAVLAIVIPFIVGCGGKRVSELSAEVKSLDGQLREANQALDSANRDVELTLRKLQEKDAEFEALKKDSEGSQTERENALERQEQLEGELEKLRREFDEYRDEYRISVWRESVGVELGELAYRGRDFRSVVIRSVDPVGISVTHADGGGRLEFEHLSEEFQKRFVYDKGKAEEYLEREKGAVVSRPVVAAPVHPPTSVAPPSPSSSPGAPLTAAERAGNTNRIRELKAEIGVSQRRINEVKKEIAMRRADELNAVQNNRPSLENVAKIEVLEDEEVSLQIRLVELQARIAQLN